MVSALACLRAFLPPLLSAPGGLKFGTPVAVPSRNCLDSDLMLLMLPPPLLGLCSRLHLQLVLMAL